jgi:hypothetical protein
MQTKRSDGDSVSAPSPAGQNGGARRHGRLKEMPPFGEPETPYPPASPVNDTVAVGRSLDDDRLGLFLPPDRAVD